MRRRRLYRWVGAGLLVAIGLYFVLDVVSLQYMQSRAGAQVARAMTAESATVKLGSVPFLPGFFAGRISNVSASINGATASGGFGVATIDFTAKVVHFSPRHMLSLARSLFSSKTTVTFDQPFMHVEIAESDLSDFIKHAVPSVGQVQVKPTGIEIRFKIPQPTETFSSFGPSPSPTPSPKPEDLLTEPARYLPVIQDRHFMLRLIDVSQIGFAYRDDAARIENLISLPPVPSSMNSDVRLGKGVIVIESSGLKLSATIGEGTS